MRKSLKYIGLFSGLVLLIVVLSLAGARGEWFKSRLREDLSGRLSSQLRGDVHFGRIDRVSLRSVEVSNVVVTLDADTVAILPSLKAGFRPWDLVSKRISVGRVEADSLALRIRQGEGGSLNVATAFAASDTSSGTGGKGGWTIDLDEIVIRGGHAVVDLYTDGSRQPLRISSFDLRSSLHMDSTLFRVAIAEFRCSMEEPRLTVSRCVGVLQEKAGVWSLEGFELSTPRNEVHGQGTWSVDDDSSRRVELTTGPIDFSEFTPFLGMRSVDGRPSIQVTGEYRANNLTFTLRAMEDDALLVLKGKLENQTLDYSVSGSMEGIEVGRWIPVTVPATLISGTFSVAGSSFGRNWLPASGRVALSHTTFDRFLVDSLDAAGSLDKGDLSASVRVDAAFGELQGSFTLSDPEGAQRFFADASFRGFDPSKLSTKDAWKGLLNGRLRAHGSGLTLPKLQGDGAIDLVDSRIGSVAVDSVRAGLRYEGRRLQVDSLLVSSPAGEIRMSGEYELSGKLDARGSIRIKDAGALPIDLAGETIGGSGRIDLAVSGPTDSIGGEASFRIADGHYATTTARALHGRLKVGGIPEVTVAEVEVHADSLRIGDLSIASADVAGGYDQGHVTGLLSWGGGEIPSGTVEVEGSLRPIPTVSLPRIELTAAGRKWSGRSGTIRIDPTRREYAVDEIDLHAGGDHIRLSAAAKGDSITDAKLTLSGLDLGALAAAFDSSLALSGRVDADLRGSGSLDDPLVSGRLQVSELSYRGSRAGDLRIEGSYGDSRLRSTVALSDSAGSDLLLTMDLPLASTGQGVMGAIDPSTPFEISIAAQRHDISWASGLMGAGVGLRGFLTSDLSMTGTMDQPRIRGALTLEEGAIKSASAGLDLGGIAFRALGHGRQLLLDSLSMGSRARVLRGHGAVAIGKNLLKGGIDSLGLVVDAAGLQVLSSKKLNITVDSHLDLQVRETELTVNGTVDLARSKIYLPAVLGAAPATKPGDLPMLVLATAPPASSPAESTAVVKRKSEFLRDARGSIRVTIPRNTWIYSSAVNVEILGAVDVLKTGPDVELFGLVEVKRGTCSILGKWFRILEGKVEFKGGPKVDPTLAMTLLYDFRDPDREKQELRLDVSGEASTPDLRFTIDGKEISQADALSYVLFGQSQDELTVSQQSSMGEEGDKMARNLAADVLAAQMSNTLARGVGLDVVELKGDENWSKASLTAGKYVSQDLYLSYELGFGDYDSNETAPESFTAEYELVRSLFLQLVSGNEQKSGVDLIWKID
jgi:translocation and assembly module TamB